MNGGLLQSARGHNGQRCKEDQLDAATKEESGDRAAEDGQVVARCVDVCREKSDEEDGEANSGRSGRGRYEESDRSEDFEDAGDGDEERGLRENGRHHLNQILSSFPPMGRGSEEEHERERDAERHVHLVERGDAQQSGNAKNRE